MSLDTENAPVKNNESFMFKAATFIVDKRNLFFLLFIFALIFCFISSGWVTVEDDITAYLAEDTETRQGLDVMNSEFVTYGSASVMVTNITCSEAETLKKKIESVNGVDSVEFDDTEEHYKDTYALFSVTFEGTETDRISINAMKEVSEALSGYDTYIDSSVGNDNSTVLANEMTVVTAVVAVIVVAVILFTSKAYAELPVLILTFGAAAILSKGTNFLVGTISFISDSVTIVLQLALAIDYAIILMNRYSEEHEKLPEREACITALSKAIPEISSSSLTTVSGLAALAFMKFGIGKDMAIVLIKAILFSLVSVFLLMPGLIMLFAPLLEKTKHKNFVPSINAVGKFAYATKYVIPPVFLVLIIAGFFCSNKCPYAYGITDLTTPRQSESQIARQKIKKAFGTPNIMAIVVPSGDYEREAKMIAEIEALEDTDSVMGLANIEAMDGYHLTDKLTPRQFAELTGLDYEAAKLIYAAFAVNDEDYGEVVGNLSSYSVPLIDMFMFAYDEAKKGYVTLDADMNDTLEELHTTLDKALVQLKTDKYTRILAYSSLPEEGDEAFALLDSIHAVVRKYYPSDSYVVGSTTSDFDLSSSFGTDNIIISVLSALFVIIILLFTFKSAGLPVLLIAVIQGSIWINFSIPYIMDAPLYFLSYLVVNSIQMGANIDYAIVISSRYMELRSEMKIKNAIITTLNQAFPTVLTSGSILCSSGLLIGILSTNAAISPLGLCLGRGTLMSMILVMCVLPQILILGDTIIEKTSFSFRKRPRTVMKNSRMAVNGMVHGFVNGRIDGYVTGVIVGDMDAKVENKAEKDTEALLLTEENYHEETVE